MGNSGEGKLFSATQIFFQGASSPSSRRSHSVEHANDNERRQSPPPLPPPPPGTEPALPVPALVHVAGDASQRGRMRVRRRSSADHLVFQRDPVARLNRPLAPSPLSFPPTTEAEEEVIARTPTSAHFVESPSASTSFPPVETPASAHNQALRIVGHSRAASLGESQKSRASSRHGRSASGAVSLHNHGHRSHSSLSLGSIFGRGSRPNSPVQDEGHPEGLHSNGSERGREKSCTKRISLFQHHSRGKKGEAVRQEEEHKEVGDGWQEFRKGTYTFPISFEIPSHMPASLECDGGSVVWKLVAKVRRPGVFTPNLIAIRDVHVVSIPADGDVDMTGEIQIQRPWDDQLQYLFKISRKSFAIGAFFNVKMVFMPLAKVRLYKLAVDIEERVDSYSSALNLTRTATSAIPLLKLQNDDATKPLLPLSSDDPLAYESSPLAAIQPLGANPSEVALQLLGPGPWPLRAKLHLPADCGLLHPTSRSRDCVIQVTHALRFTMQLMRGDDSKVDPKTGKHKLFEISVRTPVNVLSCYARAEYTALPRYSETLDESTMLARNTPVCSCAAERERREHQAGNWSQVEASRVSPTPLEEDLSELFDRTLAYERLVSGREGVLGDAPPAYEPRPPSPHPTAISV